MANPGDPLTENVIRDCIVRTADRLRREQEAAPGRPRIRWRNIWPGLCELVAGAVSDGARWLWRHSDVIGIWAGVMLIAAIVQASGPTRDHWPAVLLVAAGIALLALLVLVDHALCAAVSDADDARDAREAPLDEWQPGMTCETCPRSQRVRPGCTKLYHCPDCLGTKPAAPVLHLGDRCVIETEDRRTCEHCPRLQRVRPGDTDLYDCVDCLGDHPDIPLLRLGDRCRIETEDRVVTATLMEEFGLLTWRMDWSAPKTKDAR